MAVINDPTVAANVARVGGVSWMPTHQVAGPFPVGAGGCYRLTAPSGTIGASLGGGSELFQFRYVTGAARQCLVLGVSVGAILNVAATAAALLSLRMTVARSWTVIGSGGTRISFAGNTNKLFSSFPSSEVNDAGVATTGALTAGTKTLDTNDIGSVFYSALTGAITTVPNSQLCPPTNLFGEFTGGLGYPLILGNNEGFVIRTGPVGPATMTWGFVCNVLWSEVDAFAA